jgi:hypothetical protein
MTMQVYLIRKKNPAQKITNLVSQGVKWIIEFKIALKKIHFTTFFQSKVLYSHQRSQYKKEIKYFIAPIITNLKTIFFFWFCVSVKKKNT